MPTTTATCPREGCQLPSDPKSTKGYCPTHKAEAKAAWKQMISDKSAERQAKEQRWEELHLEAHRAGVRAGNACTPEPMVVVKHAHPLDDNSPVVKTYEPVTEGVCGFAWVVIRPATCSFARWLALNTDAHKAYHGGMSLWVGHYGQSYERKRAYARAYAHVVQEALKDEVKGFQAYAQSRLD